MAKPETPLPVDPNTDDTENSSLPTEELIKRFNTEYGGMRNLGGWGEELAQCTRLVKVMISSDSLTVDSLLQLFSRAHENIPTGATYLLAYRVIEAAAQTGKLSPEILHIIEQSVMADKDPTFSSPRTQERNNAMIMQQLLANPRLLELMMPYILPDEDELIDDDEGDELED
jgi:hypothetical protein